VGEGRLPDPGLQLPECPETLPGQPSRESPIVSGSFSSKTCQRTAACAPWLVVWTLELSHNGLGLDCPTPSPETWSLRASLVLDFGPQAAGRQQENR
jgi:hypothetical protein